MGKHITALELLTSCLNLVTDVNATMFDRYGDADDFLDSQEIKHVY
ncbi:hypothetical protein BvCmsKSP083_04555 [Escherichia coli]|nr:Uncharacterised protein [Escherichia coli]GDJ75281.1 hypothetical protein BvCmsKSNP122_00801 [Escherichia coli]GDK60850.1 hypothetical protein BvCmsKSP027_03548 [Escherichia coli]GDL49280.1 hypothetical protein BvCmsKSP003_03168 [Escherichia coli]GDM79492.1 hypothetical protein BvCmsKSP083_04555 [Escherichia coli]